MKDKIIKQTEEKMHKAVEFLRNELIKIRTGKATTTLLDNIKVDAYGQLMPLNQLANIVVSDIHTLVVQPWDKSTVQAIDKAIMASELGFNPISDGNVLRIPIPKLTEERRKEYVKLVKKFGEEGKVSIRNIRRDSIEALKKAEKVDHLPEDERKKGDAEVQKLTDKFIKNIDELLVHKEKEIMEV